LRFLPPKRRPDHFDHPFVLVVLPWLRMQRCGMVIHLHRLVDGLIGQRRGGREDPSPADNNGTSTMMTTTRGRGRGRRRRKRNDAVQQYQQYGLQQRGCKNPRGDLPLTADTSLDGRVSVPDRILSRSFSFRTLGNDNDFPYSKSSCNSYRVQQEVSCSGSSSSAISDPLVQQPPGVSTAVALTERISFTRIAFGTGRLVMRFQDHRWDDCTVSCPRTGQPLYS
jgi:hypothetical protein